MVFTIQYRISSGPNSVVYWGINLNEREPIAIKTIGSLSNANDNYSEYNILKKLKHSHIVRTLDWGFIGLDFSTSTGVNISPILHKDTVVMLLEYMQGGTLHSYIEKSGALNERTCKKYLKQLLSAVSHCHQQHVVHRDIKPQNILLDISKETLKLADFGSATVLENLVTEHQRTSSFLCTPLFAAPEVMKFDPYTYKVDIWSLGCVFIQMATGKLPFDEFRLHSMPPEEALTILSRGRYTPQIPRHLSPDAQDFIDWCLQIVPAKRASIDELLLHPFMKEGKEDSAKYTSYESDFKENDDVCKYSVLEQTTIERLDWTDQDENIQELNLLAALAVPTVNYQD